MLEVLLCGVFVFCLSVLMLGFSIMAVDKLVGYFDSPRPVKLVKSYAYYLDLVQRSGKVMETPYGVIHPDE